ncbi:thiamine phosphate synthase, partial [Rikenella microfusus]
GPVYPTTTKAVPDPVVGTTLLKKVLDFSRLPVVAIGGIFPENIAAVIDAGARNPCLVRYFMEPPDPAEVERRIACVQRMLA